MSIDAVSALTDALSALATAEKAINIALSCIGADAPAPCTRQDVAARTTSDQVLSVLSSAGGPLTLIDVADGVVALRRGEDEPRKHGGTRYQEICRTALMHLIMRGLVERIDPHDRKDVCVSSARPPDNSRSIDAEPRRPRPHGGLDLLDRPAVRERDGERVDRKRLPLHRDKPRQNRRKFFVPVDYALT